MANKLFVVAVAVTAGFVGAAAGTVVGTPRLYWFLATDSSVPSHVAMSMDVCVCILPSSSL